MPARNITRQILLQMKYILQAQERNKAHRQSMITEQTAAPDFRSCLMIIPVRRLMILCRKE